MLLLVAGALLLLCLMYVVHGSDGRWPTGPTEIEGDFWYCLVTGASALELLEYETMLEFPRVSAGLEKASPGSSAVRMSPPEVSMLSHSSDRRAGRSGRRLFGSRFWCC